MDLDMIYPDSGILPLIGLLSVSGYKGGANLSNQSRELIKSMEDLWRISLIDNIPLPTQRILGYAVAALNKKDYALCHAGWLEGERHFLGMQLGHKPSDLELIDDFKKTHVPE